MVEDGEAQTTYSSMNFIESLEAISTYQTPAVAAHNAMLVLEVKFSYKRNIYDYWKTRKSLSSNRSLQRAAKFKGPEDDDDDPYVCFRRNDSPKTKARNTKTIEELLELRGKFEGHRRLL
ncbi:hypothetical protein VE03_10766 [Pseudogymnoascus sp. 23342-1-I1]|nr:hypothetical protein VE03_10766 [Pseudogymnoascus sp. 23342-1-I1]